MVKETAIEIIKGILSPGDTVTCVRVNHGRQGRRHIIVLWYGVFFPQDKPRIEDLTSYVSSAIEKKRCDDGGIPCQDVGHDMIALLCIRCGWEYNALKVNVI